VHLLEIFNKNIRLVASCWFLSLFTLRSWCTVTRA